MTEEAKKNLLDYMLGKMPNESGVEKEIFQDINNISRYQWESGDILPSSWNDFKYEGIIQPKNSELVILYGGYKNQSNEVRGIVTILDKQMNPIKSIFQFDNENNLRYIQCMEQDEDNNFYAIDCPDFPGDRNSSFSSSQKRFIMINNFTQKINNDFVFRLQKSYIFPNDVSNFYCKQMFKDANSSHYIFLGNYLRIGYGKEFDSIRLIELKINVGSENVWKKTDDDNGGWMFGSGYVEFQNDDYFCEILMAKNSLSSNDVYMWTKDYSQPELNYLRVIATVDYFAFVDSYNMNNQTVFLNKNEVYFVLNNQYWGITGQSVSKKIGLYYYNIQSGEFKKIYEHYLGDFDFCNFESIYIVGNNNNIYIQFNNNINEEANLADYYFQRLVNNEWSPKSIGLNNFRYYQRSIFVTNEFNLLKICLYPTNPRLQTWYFCNIKEIFNENNYSGESFIDKNSLISNSAILYSDGDVVFARNLYNKTQNGATTTSTIEIPNNYLNDILIDTKNLLSKNNNIIINDTNGLTKNIYETVLLNFINTISMVNQNGSQNIYNIEAATKLNSSINNPVDYDSLKLTKFRINFQDGTNYISNLQSTLQDDGSYELLMTFYLSKQASSLDLISEDENTVYLTYNLVNTDFNNKYYSFKQRVRIGG